MWDHYQRCVAKLKRHKELFIVLIYNGVFGHQTGACRGCGWQQLATYINLATFYLIGMPIACLLAFKLQYGVKVN